MATRNKILIAISVIAVGFLLAVPTYRYIPPPQPGSRVQPTGMVGTPIRHHIPIQVNTPTALPVAGSAGDNPLLGARAAPRPLPEDYSLRQPRPGVLSPLEKEAPIPSLAADYQSGADKITSYKPPIPSRRGSGGRVHRIIDGDSIEDIAERYLGDASRAQEIFELNQDILTSPTLLPIGASLKIPPAPR